MRQWSGPFTFNVKIEEPSEADLQRAAQDGFLLDEKTVTGYFLVPLDEIDLLDVLATQGGEDPDGRPALMSGNEAQSDLWQKLQSGQLFAEGFSKRESVRARIRDAEWIDLYYYWGPKWPAHAVGLIGEDEPRYFDVRVRSSRVIELWPRIENRPDIYRTGAPGRPTSSELVIDEAKRRLGAGERSKSLTQFAEALAAWHAENKGPLAPPMKAGTIRNVVRKIWNAARK